VSFFSFPAEQEDMESSLRGLKLLKQELDVVVALDEYFVGKKLNEL
jgi:hypothetical protein